MYLRHSQQPSRQRPNCTSPRPSRETCTCPGFTPAQVWVAPAITSARTSKALSPRRSTRIAPLFDRSWSTTPWAGAAERARGARDPEATVTNSRRCPIVSSVVNRPGSEGRSASSLIEYFLRANPRGELFVAVGYASVAGIAWLAERVEDRPVTLLIGNVRRNHFTEMSVKDRDAAMRFLRRADVQVLTWYQRARDDRPAREAHLKVWAVMAESPRRRGRGAVEAMLVGSGNLTKAGLFHNEEAFAHAAGEDLRRVGAQLERLRSHQWKRNDKILEYITPEQVAERPGCLASLLPGVVAATLTAAARALLGPVRLGKA